eukprot:CAMPEP_0119010618 /NCGR_PEP_ID=MMETSP1176-20130426/5134_1 /TAXON_ID=265551 /ORGANISM="Synedropsis recta cf, Strain CCMP1620" /LENGTH=277 /DNA_ID=CAMNT_0006963317 /DNA_START=131 /DNA_END=964 /DNA_ORIENTATION=+
MAFPQHDNNQLFTCMNSNMTINSAMNLNEQMLHEPAAFDDSIIDFEHDNQLFLSITQQLAGEMMMANDNDNNQPNNFDVICGKGKRAFNHSGNKLFRQIVLERLDLYSTATTKLEKSMVVSDIMTCVRMNGGDFVKQQSGSSPFQRVSERAAREKIGQQIRDALHTQYKSSTKAKKRKRVAARDREQEEINRIVAANLQVTQILTTVTEQVSNSEADAADAESSDDEIVELFRQANLKMLDAFKQSNSAEAFSDAVEGTKKQTDSSSSESSDDESLS